MDERKWTDMATELPKWGGWFDFRQDGVVWESYRAFFRDMNGKFLDGNSRTRYSLITHGEWAHPLPDPVVYPEDALTVGALRRALDGVPDDQIVMLYNQDYSIYEAATRFQVGPVLDPTMPEGHPRQVRIRANEVEIS